MSRLMLKSWRTQCVLSLVVVVLLAACGGGGSGGGGGPADPGGTQLPTALFTVTPGTTVFVGQALELNAVASFSANDTDPIVSYRWEFGTGSIVVRSVSTESFTYTISGVYTIRLTVTTAAGLSGSSVQSVTVASGNPVASITAPSVTLVGDPVSFAGTGTPQFGADSISSFGWDFGDGGTSSDQNPNHTYVAPSTPGTYTVALTVTDNIGRVGSTGHTIRVHQAPVARAGTNRSVTVGGSLMFEGSASFDPDSDGSMVLYEWDFDYEDPFTSSPVTGPGATQSFETVGTFTVALRVTDNDGAVSDLDTVVVTVVAEGENLPPVADIGGPYEAVLLGNGIEFDGSASFDPDGDTLDYEWDFGDGNTSTLESPLHSYADRGVYTVTVTVTDSEGASDSAVVEVIVHTRPIAVAQQSTMPRGHALVGDSIVFSGAESTSGQDGGGNPSDDAGDFLTLYGWQFSGQGSPLQSVPTVSRVFETPGTHEVRLRVQDRFGVRSTRHEDLEPADLAVHVLEVYERPVANIGGPYGANLNNVFNPGDSIEIDAGQSTVDVRLDVEYAWDFRYSGVAFDAEPGEESSATTFIVPDEPGIFALATRLTVRALDEGVPVDPPLAVLVDSISYRINARPVAAFTYEATEYHVDADGGVLGLFCDLPAQFVSQASDQDGTIVSHSWEVLFGGSALLTRTERDPQIQFACADVTGDSVEYEIRLEVTDNDGAASLPEIQFVQVFKRSTIDIEIE